MLEQGLTSLSSCQLLPRKIGEHYLLHSATSAGVESYRDSPPGSCDTRNTDDSNYQHHTPGI